MCVKATLIASFLPFFVTVCQEGNFEQLHLTQLVCAHAVNLFIGRYEEAILIIYNQASTASMLTRGIFNYIASFYNGNGLFEAFLCQFVFIQLMCCFSVCTCRAMVTLVVHSLRERMPALKSPVQKT